MKVIGIVGGIASGKTTVAQELRRLGSGHINADKIGHDVLEIEEIRQQLEMRWSGNGYGHITKPSGEIRRDIIANIVFNDPKELEFLNDVCHPVIHDRIEQKLGYFHPEYTKAVVLDVPLLLEAEWNVLCDIIVFVECPIDKRGQRASKRTECTLDLAELKKREGCQMSVTEKRAFASAIIDNSQDKKQLLQEVLVFWKSEIDE
tara:strand:- start:4164 stop:4775 length:612 start_codon:yes stop_codon:yes gene_type:complete